MKGTWLRSVDEQGIEGLPVPEERSCGYDDMLSREDRRDSRLRDQNIVDWILWDTCRECKLDVMRELGGSVSANRK